jgi:predicted phage terminase large subunit-like protein
MDQLRTLRYQSLRRLARTDDYHAIEAYGELVFGNVPAKHHSKMLEWTLDAIWARQNTVILMPRGGAKTTWDNTTLLSWLQAKHPDIRIGLVSNTDTQAKAFSRAIKYTVEANDEFKNVFPECRPSDTKWTDKEWLNSESKWHSSKDVTCFAVGVGGAIISKRFDIIFMDDILDEENTQTVDQREAVEVWFKKTLKPCLAPDGVVIVVGTRWGDGDLYEQFMEDTKEGGFGWTGHITSALTEDKDGHLQSYWPEYWTVDRLLKEKEEMGTPLFSCAYQNDISGLLAGNIFHGPFDYFDILPEGHKWVIRMGVDLASSESERADFTSRVVSAEDKCGKECLLSGNFYVLSAYRDKRESHHTEFIHDGWRAYPNIDLVITESNQFQSTLIHQVMEAYPQIPIVGRRADQDKTTRARAVAAKYEAHKVFHHKSLRGSALEREELSFPKGHDDMVDSLGYSMDLGGSSFFFGSLKKTGEVEVRAA